MFFADCRRPVMARPALGLVSIALSLLVNREPVGTLPTGLLAKNCSEFFLTFVSGREPERTDRLALLIRVVNVIVLGVCFNRARQHIRLSRVVGSKAPDVKAPHVPFRMPLGNPFGHDFTHSTCPGETVRAEGGCNP